MMTHAKCIPVRLAIADDHPIVIDGLKNIVRDTPGLELAGTYTDGESLLKGLVGLQPEVLLLDIQMPGRSGDQIAPEILDTYPDIRIIALTNFDSVLYVNAMLHAGVHGYLLKSTDKSTLLGAIRTVVEGRQYMDEALREKLRTMEPRMMRMSTSRLRLTTREKEILQCIVNGDTCPEIAARLFLSVHTIEKYRDNILIKLDVKNTAALVKKALLDGLAS